MSVQGSDNWIHIPLLISTEAPFLQFAFFSKSKLHRYVCLEKRYDCPANGRGLKYLIRVIPIDGRKERVQFDKITARVSRLCYGLDSDHVDAATITQKVISGVYQGVTTVELDNLVCAQSRLQQQIL